MHKFLFLFYFLGASITTFAQFVVDTQSTVTINAPALKPVGVFSTFADKTNGGENSKLRLKNGIAKFSFPAAIRIVNYKGYAIRIDSMEVKMQKMDSLENKLTIFLAQNEHLTAKSPISTVTRKGKVYSFKLVNPINITTDTSYLSFYFSFSNLTNFYVYTNDKIRSITCGYEKDLDRLYIVDDKDLSFIGAPQIKLYYTKFGTRKIKTSTIDFI